MHVAGATEAADHRRSHPGAAARVVLTGGERLPEELQDDRLPRTF